MAAPDTWLDRARRIQPARWFFALLGIAGGASLAVRSPFPFMRLAGVGLVAFYVVRLSVLWRDAKPRG